ncbi:hypothetical protein LJR245_004243 [Rhizobium leguminosarum]|uniref:Uncharacterized protein n=1 Tax=Rhizobium leguminosarum TaxID=384 RepID=A0A179BCW8_RHILE|nr:hypothetical protein [Rhizobium leguminosarum]OAP89546.1 hypothetical protein A4U53_32395 [Rhizobium leguminosarum]
MKTADDPFRLVLWLTLFPGALAVLAFLMLVCDPEQSPNPALKFFSTLRGRPARFKRYLSAVGIFGIGDFSHSLLILAATQLRTPCMGSSGPPRLPACSTSGATSSRSRRDGRHHRDPDWRRSNHIDNDAEGYLSSSLSCQAF